MWIFNARKWCYFSDGIEEDYLHFNAGCIVQINIADRQGQLIAPRGVSLFNDDYLALFLAP